MMVGHGTFIGHFESPTGFRFTNDMYQAHLKPGQSFRDLLVERVWQIEKQTKELNTHAR